MLASNESESKAPVPMKNDVDQVKASAVNSDAPAPASMVETNASTKQDVSSSDQPVTPADDTDADDSQGKDDKQPAFSVQRRTEGSIAVTEFLIRDATIINNVSSHVRSEGLYVDPPTLQSQELFSILPKLKKAVEHEEPVDADAEVFCNDRRNHGKRGLGKLVAYLEREHRDTIAVISKMVKKGKIGFKYLWHLFSEGSYGFTEQMGTVHGFMVDKAVYQKCFFGSIFVITGKSIDSDGTHFKFGVETFYICEFDDIVDIVSLAVQPLDSKGALYATLTERGKLFEKYALGNTYVAYTGKMFRMTFCGPSFFKADGRVMVDVVSFAQMNPNYDMGAASARQSHRRHFGGDNSNDMQKMPKVPEHLYFLCSATVYGFSFVSKKWGQIFVEHLAPIQFDDHAFQRLVLDADRKQLILNLVNSGSACSLDLINGKGGGMIFLLHGTPGVGKTLTGESVAEHLHRPLYSVSAGELGTDVLSLERKLSEILEVASVWQAVILIDEADIFLERRGENDIHRNALVGIFLRLLEYHQGILFLTTNRVQCFDGAFKSRITLALKYGDLDEAARRQIWCTFLDRSEGAGKWANVDVDELKNVWLNGREIKNVVRLAKAMSGNTTDPIKMDNIRKVLFMMRSFDEEVDAEGLSASIDKKRIRQ
ncbi:P-loop containing nucleoside triphosphate hydrolase protein [Chytriomyces sp. MP71]|nr:P-loop containing nucleoside triphosphate hydrolase protein [Chytriomyces sp. MP71]